MENSLEGFKIFLSKLDLKETTISRHAENIRYVFKHCDVSDPSETSIVELLLDNRRRGNGATYTNALTASINHYRAFCGLPPIDIPYYKKRPAPKGFLSDEEIEAFLGLPPPMNSPNWDLWTKYFSILAYTGARPGEIASLRKRSCDFGRNVFVLEDTKTRDVRLVPMPTNLKEAIKQLYESSKDYLFPGETQVCFNKASWKHQFNSRIKRLGIVRPNLTCHSLRHSFITRMLDESVDLFTVQKIVGHKHISTTAVYRHLTTKDITDAMQKDPMVRKSINPRLVLVAILEWVTRLIERDDRFEKSITDNGDEIVVRVKIKKADAL